MPTEHSLIFNEKALAARDQFIAQAELKIHNTEKMAVRKAGALEALKKAKECMSVGEMAEILNDYRDRLERQRGSHRSCSNGSSEFWRLKSGIEQLDAIRVELVVAGYGDVPLSRKKASGQPDYSP